MTITVYSRPGCHLCDELMAELTPLCQARGVTPRVVDVESDPELSRRWGMHIPVVVGEEGELCRHRLDRRVIENYLEALAAGH
ncbi:MAG: glutaredoxin family protein [Gammaproteobacteria bacterium]|jgi:hypothetical protein